MHNIVTVIKIVTPIATTDEKIQTKLTVAVLKACLSKKLNEHTYI